MEGLTQLLAVVIGGLLTFAGGFWSNYLLERQKARDRSRNLALAFRGEIGAVVNMIETRRYTHRLAEIVAGIEATGKPFFMPMRIRYRYDRVYDSNVESIGLLRGRLPELIPQFYTQLNSGMEDMANLGDKLYAELDLPTLVRIYKDLARIIEITESLGGQILAEIDAQYGKRAQLSTSKATNRSVTLRN